MKNSEIVTINYTDTITALYTHPDPECAGCGATLTRTADGNLLHLDDTADCFYARYEA